jgi:hypothetical protein
MRARRPMLVSEAPGLPKPHLGGRATWLAGGSGSEPLSVSISAHVTRKETHNPCHPASPGRSRRRAAAL